jgi:uncharacterized damage-inducible protein DinB
MAGTKMPSAKEQYKTTFEREHPITKKVLRAYPADKGAYKNHPNNSTALQIAWTFVIENNVAMAALKGPLKLDGAFPPPPAKFEEVITAYEKTSKQLLDAVMAAPDSRLGEKIAFPTGPKQMGEMPVIDFLWFMLMDSIHHRGQLSVYIRPAGGKVPSIYGPSGDEPWM